MEIYGTVVALGKDDKPEEKTFIIKKRKFIIGSHALSDITLSEPSNSLGTRHCEISIDPFGRVSLINHDKIAILLNGHELKKRRPLEPGSIIEIGSHKFRWEKRATTPELTQPEKQIIINEKSYTDPLHTDKLKRKRDKDIRIDRKFVNSGRYTLLSIANEEKDENNVENESVSGGGEPTTSISHMVEDKENISDVKEEPESLPKHIIAMETSHNSINQLDMSDDCVILDATVNDSTVEEPTKDKLLTPIKQEEDDELIVLSTPAVFLPKNNIVNILLDSDEDEFEDCKLLSPGKLNIIDKTIIKMELSTEEINIQNDSSKIDNNNIQTESSAEDINDFINKSAVNNEEIVTKPTLSTEEEINLKLQNNEIHNDCQEKSIVQPEFEDKQTRSDEIIENEVDLNVSTPPLRLTKESQQIASVKAPLSPKSDTMTNNDDDLINITLIDSQELVDDKVTIKENEENYDDNVANSHDEQINNDIIINEQPQEPIFDHLDESTPPLRLIRQSLWVTSIKSARKLGNSQINTNEKTNTTLNDSQELVETNSVESTVRHKLRFSVDSPTNEVINELNNETNQASQSDYEISESLVVTNDDDTDNTLEKIEIQQKSNNTNMGNILAANPVLNQPDDKKTQETYLSPLKTEMNESQRTSLRLSCTKKLFSECSYDFRKSIAKKTLEIGTLPKIVPATIVRKINNEDLLLNTTENVNEVQIPLNENHEEDIRVIFDDKTNKKPLNNSTPIGTTPARSIRSTRKGSITIMDMSNLTSDEQTQQTPSRILRTRRASIATLNETTTPIETPTRSLRTRKGSLIDLSTSNQVVDTPSSILRTRKCSSALPTEIETPTRALRSTRTRSVTRALETPIPKRILRRTRSSSVLINDDETIIESTDEDDAISRPPDNITHTPKSVILKQKSSLAKTFTPKSAQKLKMDTIKETTMAPENILPSKSVIIESETTSITEHTEITKSSSVNIIKTTSKHVFTSLNGDQVSEDVSEIKETIVSPRENTIKQLTEGIKTTKTITSPTKNDIDLNVLELITEDNEHVAEITENIETFLLPSEKILEQENKVFIIPVTIEKENPIENYNLNTFEATESSVNNISTTKCSDMTKTIELSPRKLESSSENEIINTSMSIDSSLTNMQATPDVAINTNHAENTIVINSTSEEIVEHEIKPINIFVTTENVIESSSTVNIESTPEIVIEKLKEQSKNINTPELLPENETNNHSITVESTTQTAIDTRKEIQQNVDVNENKQTPSFGNDLEETNESIDTSMTSEIIEPLPQITSTSEMNDTKSTKIIESTTEFVLNTIRVDENDASVIDNLEMSEKSINMSFTTEIKESLKEKKVDSVSVSIKSPSFVETIEITQEIAENTLKEQKECTDLAEKETITESSYEQTVELSNEDTNKFESIETPETLPRNEGINISELIHKPSSTGSIEPTVETKLSTIRVHNMSATTEIQQLSTGNKIDNVSIMFESSSSEFTPEIVWNTHEEDQESAELAEKPSIIIDSSFKNTVELTNEVDNTPKTTETITSLPENEIINVSKLSTINVDETGTDVAEFSKEQINTTEMHKLSTENKVYNVSESLPSEFIKLTPEIGMNIPKKEQANVLLAEKQTIINSSLKETVELTNKVEIIPKTTEIITSLPENEIINIYKLSTINVDETVTDVAEISKEQINTTEMHKLSTENKIHILSESLPSEFIKLTPEIGINTPKKEQANTLLAGKQTIINSSLKEIVELKNEVENMSKTTETITQLLESEIINISKLSTIKVDEMGTNEADISEEQTNKPNNMSATTEIQKLSSENKVDNVSETIKSSFDETIELIPEIAENTLKEGQESTELAEITEIIDSSFVKTVEQTNEEFNTTVNTKAIESLQELDESTTEIVSTIQVDHENSNVAEVSGKIDLSSEIFVEQINETSTNTTETSKINLDTTKNYLNGSKITEDTEYIDSSFELTEKQTSEDTNLFESLVTSTNYESINISATFESSSTEVIELTPIAADDIPKEEHTSREIADNNIEPIDVSSEKIGNMSIKTEIIESSLHVEPLSTEIIELTSEICVKEEKESSNKETELTQITNQFVTTETNELLQEIDTVDISVKNIVVLNSENLVETVKSEEITDSLLDESVKPENEAIVIPITINILEESDEHDINKSKSINQQTINEIQVCTDINNEDTSEKIEEKEFLAIIDSPSMNITKSTPEFAPETVINVNEIEDITTNEIVKKSISATTSGPTNEVSRIISNDKTNKIPLSNSTPIETPTRILRKRKGSMSTDVNVESSVVTPTRKLRTTRSQSVTHNSETPTRSLRRTRSSSILIEDPTNIGKLTDLEEVDGAIPEPENIIQTPKSTVRKQKGSILKKISPKSVRKLKMETIEEIAQPVASASSNISLDNVKIASNIKNAQILNKESENVTTNIQIENAKSVIKVSDTETIDTPPEITVEHEKVGIIKNSIELALNDDNKHKEEQKSADIVENVELIETSLFKIEKKPTETESTLENKIFKISGTIKLSSTTNIIESTSEAVVNTIKEDQQNKKDSNSSPNKIIEPSNEVIGEINEITTQKPESKQFKRGRKTKKDIEHQSDTNDEQNDPEKIIQPELKKRGRNRKASVEKSTEELIPKKIGRTRRGTATIHDSETKTNHDDDSTTLASETIQEKSKSQEKVDSKPKTQLKKKTDTAKKDSDANEPVNSPSTNNLERRTRGRANKVAAISKQSNSKEEIIEVSNNIDQGEAAENSEKILEDKTKSTSKEPSDEAEILKPSRSRKRNIVTDKVSVANNSTSTKIESHTKNTNITVASPKPETKKRVINVKNAELANAEDTVENEIQKPETTNIEAVPRLRGRQRNVGANKVSAVKEKTDSSTIDTEKEENVESQKTSDAVTKPEPNTRGRKRKTSELTTENDNSDKIIVEETEKMLDVATNKPESKIVKKGGGRKKIAISFDIQSTSSHDQTTESKVKSTELPDSELQPTVAPEPKRQGRRKNVVPASTTETDQIETISQKIGRTRRGTADSVASNSSEKPEIKTRGRKRNIDSVTIESEEKLEEIKDTQSLVVQSKVGRRGRQKFVADTVENVSTEERKVVAADVPVRSLRSRK